MNIYFKNLIDNSKKLNGNDMEKKLDKNDNNDKSKINNIDVNKVDEKVKDNDFLKLFENFIFT
tara:strand:+ start:204 stop:392 length:189 start_codon:yes stop_codon:yes gene_type:complete